HPGSARQEKLWEPERWAEVIKYFGSNDGIDLVLTSGPSQDEQTHIAAIKNRTQHEIIDLSGETDLLTLAALIGQARLLVTVDSAPVHMAAATRTPLVILFGPTNPFHWRPRESPAVVLHGKSAAPVTEFSPAAPLPIRWPCVRIFTFWTQARRSIRLFSSVWPSRPSWPCAASVPTEAPIACSG